MKGPAHEIFILIQSSRYVIKIYFSYSSTEIWAEHSGSVGRALDGGSNGC